MSNPTAIATVPADSAQRLVAPVLTWYQVHARDLPWRRKGVGSWPILVSEIMLQQTPVERVRPAYEAWVMRWPTPAALAGEPAGEAVRAWGRLGYPRRALWLHACATTIVDKYGGDVPRAYEDLLTLPGVGVYTAAAVASFAFAQRRLVLDTNSRRLLARAIAGVAQPPPGGPTAAERRQAEAAIPDDSTEAAHWAVASMELGALVCTARVPRCDACPIAAGCAWRNAGRPAYAGPRRGQNYAGTDRQARGRLLDALRTCPKPITADKLAEAWPADPAQRERALRGLLTDGLVEALADGHYRLPS
jgi:A/G-specific adenine glycosylase